MDIVSTNVPNITVTNVMSSINSDDKKERY